MRRDHTGQSVSKSFAAHGLRKCGHRNARRMILAVAPVAIGLCGRMAMATIDQWGGGTTTGAYAEWSTAGNFTVGNSPPHTGDVLNFNNSSSAFNSDDNLGDGFNISGISFNTGAGAYNLTSGAGANNQSLLLTGALIDNAANAATTIQTVNFVINGATTSSLVLGSDASAGNGIAFNANQTFGSLSVNTNSSSGTPAADVLIIGATSNVIINGPLSVGIQSATAASNSNLNSYTGTAASQGSGGTLTVNGTVTIGGANTNGTSTKDNTVVDWSAYNGVTINSSAGALNIGYGQNLKGVLTLASGLTSSNFINVSAINIGTTNVGIGATFNVQPGSGLVLGSGTNTIESTAILIGQGKGNGTISFLNANGSVGIIGTGGTGLAAITLGLDNVAGTATGTASQLLLAGHNATVMAGALVIGNSNATGTTIPVSQLTFDTGTFNASSVAMATVTNTAGVNSTFTLGTTAASTGTFNDSGAFVLASDTSTATAVGNDISALNINGGTANFNNGISVTSTKGITNATFNLSGGTLNLNGSGIGNSITGATLNMTANLPATGQSVTLLNLGGSGVFATAGNANTAGTGGLNLSGGGLVVLAGTKTGYTGPTIVGSGSTLQIGSGALGATFLSTGTFTNNGIVNIVGSQPSNISSAITGTGVLNHNTSSTTVLSGTSSYSGGTNLIGGTLAVTGGLSSTGTLNISGGTLAGGTTASPSTVGNVIMTSGAIHPGASALDQNIGTLSVSSLNVSAGDMRFDLGPSSGDAINDSGTAIFTGGTVSLALDGVPQSSYTIVSSTGLTGTPTLSTTSIGRTSFSLTTSGNNLKINVVGSGPASLIWGKKPGAAGDGVTWDGVQDQQNFTNNGAADTFYTVDLVTFNDSNFGFNTVSVVGSVTPTSTTFSNNTTNYTIGGTGSISGITGLLVNGAGSVTLNNSNNYTGDTNVNSGALILGTGGSIADTNVNINGGTLNISGGTLASTNLNISSGTVNLTGGSAAAVNVIDNGTVNVTAPLFPIGALTGSGAITLNGGILSFGATGTVTNLLQNGASAGGVNVSAGTVTLMASNTYTGPTSVAAGATLQVGNNTSAGSITQTTPLGLTGTLAYNSSSPLAVNNTITGTGVLASIGSGTTTIGGNIIGFTGAFNVGGGGSLVFSAAPLTLANAIGAVGNGTVANAGKLIVAGSVNTSTSALTLNVSPFGGTLSDGVAADMEITGPVIRTSGTGLIKTGTGVLALSGNGDNVNLAATVNAGTLLLNKNSSSTAHAIGGGGLTINSGGTVQITGTGGDQIYDTGGITTVNDGGLFDMNGQSETVFSVTLGSTANAGTGVLADNLANSTSTLSLLGTFKLAGNANVYAANGSTFTVTSSGGSAGSGATLQLIKTGPGTVVLSGSEDDANMSGNVSQGTLVLNKNTSGGAHGVNGITAVALGATLQLGNGGGFGGDQIYDGFAGSNFGVFNMNGTLDFNGQNEGFDKITGTGTVINSQPSVQSVFTLGTNNLAGATQPDFAGAITGNIALVKLGASAIPLTLSGSNTYTGFTNVSAGTLQIGDGGAGGMLGTGPTTLGANTSLYFNNSNPTLLVSSSIGGLGQIIQVGSGTTTLSGTNTYTGDTFAAGGVLALNSAEALPFAVPANNFFGTNLHIFGTTVVANQMTTRTTLQLSSLDNEGGTLDLNNNAIDIYSGNANFSDVYNQVATGFHGGAWNGSAGSEQIISTSATNNPHHLTALGVIVNDNGSGSPLYGSGGTISATFNGVTPSVDDVLVKYTYYGDANLDGKVDASDYSRIDAAYASGGSLTGWYNGDFNYDGVINGSDYTLIDNAFNTQGAALSAELATPTAEIADSGSSAVPEPTTLSMIGIGAAGLLGRRRGRRHN